jgi:hypothetical protein
MYLRRLYFFLLAYLVLALMVSSSISAGEAFCFEHVGNDSLNSGTYFSSIKHIVDWLPANALTLRKARGYSNSLLQNRLFRVFTLAGTTAIALYLAGANLKILENDNVLIIKDLVLLKLKI